jgi:hypothetical protein
MAFLRWKMGWIVSRCRQEHEQRRRLDAEQVIVKQEKLFKDS